MRAFLIPVDGGNPLEIRKDLLLVGRHADCDLRLDHKTVSKMHCVLLKSDDMVLLRDLGSTNGCRVNGQRVKRAALLHRDVLSIASHKYRVEYGQGDAPVDESPIEDIHPESTQLFDVSDLDDDVSDEELPAADGPGPIARKQKPGTASSHPQV